MVLATFFFGAVAGARAGVGVGLVTALLATGDFAATFLPAVFATVAPEAALAALLLVWATFVAGFFTATSHLSFLVPL